MEAIGDRRRRLRWYGYVQRKGDADWVKGCTVMVVEGTGGSLYPLLRPSCVSSLYPIDPPATPSGGLISLGDIYVLTARVKCKINIFGSAYPLIYLRLAFKLVINTITKQTGK